MSDTLRYYILFKTHEQSMALHQLLDEAGIPNRIAPAPRCLQGELSCGVSLLIHPDDLDQAKACIADHQAEYYDILPLEGQLKAKRDRYC